MNWTHEKPTAPGWYWVRDDTFPPHVFEIVEYTDGGVTQLYGKWINGKDKARMDVLGAFNPLCEFAGPIPEPDAAPQGWQPIATAPKDGTDVLILFDSATVDVVRLCCWDDGGPRPWEADPTKPRPDEVGWWSYKHSVTNELLHYMTPIAWMPMPDCPASFYPYPR